MKIMGENETVGAHPGSRRYHVFYVSLGLFLFLCLCVKGGSSLMSSHKRL
jgi:hypothetical protein